MLTNHLVLKSEVRKDLLNETLLKYLEPFEQEEVAEVFYYMLSHYRKKKLMRANGYPAEVHPVEVAEILDFNAHLMKVALLHDLIEDIPENNKEEKALLNEIRIKFGSEVAEAVNELTKYDDDYEKYIHNIKRKDAIIVKEADMLTNVRSCNVKKLHYMKYKLPGKVRIFLKHLSTIKTKEVTLYVHAFYKYYAKIIEEYFRNYESQIKNLKELHKGFNKEIDYLESQLASFYKEFGIIRKTAYKKFVDGLLDQKLEARNHLKIELLKRTKEALISQQPINSTLISIDQNVYLYEKTKDLEPALSYKLKEAIQQQIKTARLESFRLQHYFDIILQNKKLLHQELHDELENPIKKIKALEQATKKIDFYARMMAHE